MNEEAETLPRDRAVRRFDGYATPHEIGIQFEKINELIFFGRVRVRRRAVARHRLEPGGAAGDAGGGADVARAGLRDDGPREAGAGEGREKIKEDTVSKTKEKKNASVHVEVEFGELGPNEMLGFHQSVATAKGVEINGKKFDIELCQSLHDNSFQLDLNDKTTYPKGPLKSRRITLSLRQVFNAAIAYLEKYPKPPEVK